MLPNLDLGHNSAGGKKELSGTKNTSLIPSVGQNRRFSSNWSRWNKLPLFGLIRIKNYRTERIRRFHTPSGSPILLVSI